MPRGRCATPERPLPDAMKFFALALPVAGGRDGRLRGGKAALYALSEKAIRRRSSSTFRTARLLLAAVLLSCASASAASSAAVPLPAVAGVVAYLLINAPLAEGTPAPDLDLAPSYAPTAADDDKVTLSDVSKALASATLGSLLFLTALRCYWFKSFRERSLRCLTDCCFSLPRCLLNNTPPWGGPFLDVWPSQPIQK